MTRRRRMARLIAISLGVLAPGCTGDGASPAGPSPPAAPTTGDDTATTTASTTSVAPSTSAVDTSAPPSAPTSTTTPTTVEPAAVPTVLLAGIDGAWLWSADGKRQLLVDAALSRAVPDRVGGILYQRVETGDWRPDERWSVDRTARWAWIGDGEAQPIRRLVRPGGPDEIVVRPPADGTVRLFDAALVDGNPVLAYERTRYFTVTATEPDENPWWDSAIAELVVRDLTTGRERVLRTQSVGWESSERTPTLGSDLAADVVGVYGDPSAIVELFELDGSPAGTAVEPPRCESCAMVADLGPAEPELAVVVSELSAGGTPADVVDAEVVEPRTGAVLSAARVDVPAGARPISLDVVGGTSLLRVATWTPVPASERPELRRGDRGPWVAVVQGALSTGGTSLAPDGVFGPRTEAAVVAVQSSAGLTANGIVDEATWLRLIGGADVIPEVLLVDDPILIAADGSSRSLPVLVPGGPVPMLGGPTAVLWTGA